MSRSKHKQAATYRSPKKITKRTPLDSLRTGMPALDSITGVDEFRKGNQVFQIIHTNEVDAYEQAPSKGKRKKR